MDNGDFGERLMKAAKHANVAYSQQAIGTFLGTDRRKVDVWMKGGLPRADTLFDMADKFGVDPRWFATGEGDMLPRPKADNLAPGEETLLSLYREADPRWQFSLRLLAHCATEEQLEAATDVNVVMARIFAKRPKDIRPVSNKAVERAYGDAPHVAARKREREKG